MASLSSQSLASRLGRATAAINSWMEAPVETAADVNQALDASRKLASLLAEAGELLPTSEALGHSATEFDGELLRYRETLVALRHRLQEEQETAVRIRDDVRSRMTHLRHVYQWCEANSLLS